MVETMDPDVRPEPFQVPVRGGRPKTYAGQGRPAVLRLILSNRQTPRSQRGFDLRGCEDLRDEWNEASEHFMVASGVWVCRVMAQALPPPAGAVFGSRKHGEEWHPEIFQAAVRLS